MFYIFYMNEVPNKINFCENYRSIYNRILFVLNEKYSWKAIRMRHAENADQAASQARNWGKGGKPPLPYFENLKKCPNFGEKMLWLCPSLI